MTKNSPLKFRCQISTPDNWHPTSEGMVEASCSACPDPTRKGLWYFSVTFMGDDDFGMTKYVENLSRGDAVRMFRDWMKTLIRMESVTIKGLEAIGFQRF